MFYADTREEAEGIMQAGPLTPAGIVKMPRTSSGS